MSIKVKLRDSRQQELDLDNTTAEVQKEAANVALQNIQDKSEVALPVNEVESFENIRNPNFTPSDSGTFLNKLINDPQMEDKINDFKDTTIGPKEGIVSDMPKGFEGLPRQEQEELRTFNRVGDTIVDRVNKLPNTNQDGNLLSRITSIIDHVRAGFNLPTQVEPKAADLNGIDIRELRASLEPQNESIDGRTRAEATAQPLGKILNRFDSLERIAIPTKDGDSKFKTIIKSDMLAIGLALTEKSFAEGMYADPKAYRESMLEAARDEDLTTEERVRIYEKIKKHEDDIRKGDQVAPKVAKNQGLEVLGRDIAQEYLIKTQRQDRIGEIDSTEAQHLAGYFKELWSRNHSVDGDNIFKDGIGLVNRYQADQSGKQIDYQLTPLGVEYLTGRSSGSRDILNILFPPKNVRPSKRPLPQGSLPGVIGAIVKPISGILGTNRKSVDKDKYLQEATENLSTIAHVVNKRRNKLLLLTALPSIATLSPAKDSQNPNMWMAEINSLGNKKYQAIRAEKVAQDRRKQYAESQGLEFKEIEINPDEEFARLKIKAARTLQSIQLERDGENYLTYSVQGYSGRIAPQQTLFNPTANKDVRFVTTSGAPVEVKKGNKKEKILRQMYALMLLPSISEGAADNEGQGTASGADMLLPDAREFQLKANTRQLYEWGERLSTALDSAIPNTLYETIANEVVGDIDYQQSTAAKSNIDLGLDPSLPRDKALIDAIQGRGEDGLAFMDGLIDFYNYQNAMNKGIPFRTFFNAYIDGKTNGLATNGFQNGHLLTGFQTGVIRKGEISLLDDGDLRDNLQVNNMKILQDDIGGSATPLFNRVLDDFTVIAAAIFSNRELNKQTTMTWGYGAELSTFKKSIDDVIDQYVATYQFQSENGTLSPEGLAFLQSLDKIMVNDEINNKVPSKEALRNFLVEDIHALYVKGLQQTLSPDVIIARTLLRGAALSHTLLDELMVFKTHSGYELNVGGKVSRGLEKDPETGKYITESGQYGFDNLDGQGNKITQYNYETQQTPQAKTSKKEAGEVTWGGALPAPVQSIDGSVVAMTVAGDSWKKLSANTKTPYVHTIYDAFKMDVDSYETVLSESNKNWMKINESWNYMEEALKSLDNSREKFANKVRDNPTAPIPKHTVEYLNYLFSPVDPFSQSKSPLLNLESKLLKLDKELKFLGSSLTEEQKIKYVKMISKSLGMRFEGKLPPYDTSEINMREYGNFVSQFLKSLNLRNSMRYHIGLMNRNKKVLLKAIKEEGLGYEFNGEFIPLQYYAH